MVRRLRIVTTSVVAAVWTVFWAVWAVVFSVSPANVVLTLVVSTLLWVCAARVVLRRWSSRADTGPSTVDGPGRLLAAAVAAMPEHRRDWGSAMLAELAEIRGRSDRWRFALSSARATLLLRVNRFEPLLGAGAALVYAGGAVLLTRAIYPGILEAPGVALALFAGLWLWYGPLVALFYVAWAAASIGRSFRSGVWAAVWAIATMPLAHSFTTSGAGHLSLSFYEGDSLSFFAMAIVVFGAPFGVFGAAVGVRRTRLAYGSMNMYRPVNRSSASGSSGT